MSRALSSFGLVLGVTFTALALYLNAAGRADGNDPSPWLYALGAFGVLMILAVVIEAIEEGRS